MTSLASPETGLWLVVRSNAATQLKALRRATIGPPCSPPVTALPIRLSARLAINRG